jgi:hypothetical protein
VKRLLSVTLGLTIAMVAMAESATTKETTEPIPIEYFGLHFHRADQGTAWPNVPFGSWRLWDAYVNWSQLEPRRGQWDFSRLDRYVAMAKLTKVDLLLPLANTPTWAASRPGEHSGYQPGNASEPLLIDDWRNYVRTVGERYKGTIKLYEIWNEPNIKHHFSGTPEKLVELTCEAYKILKAIDPENRIVSPAATAGAKGHVAALDKFLATGGKQCIDIVAHHFYVPNSGPEAMVPLIRQVRAVMQKNGIADKPLWNTETGWWIANDDGTPDHPMVTRGGWKKLASGQQAGDYLFHAFLLARAEGIGRFYWYSWDNRYGLGMINPTTGKPKQMTESWHKAVDTLLGATNLKCDQLGNAWVCSFVSANGSLKELSWSVD